MIWQIVKWSITATIVVAASTLAKKYTMISSLFAALPMVSLLAMTWMYFEGQDTETINQFSRGVFWMVLPSLPMFLLLPKLVEKFNFPLAMLGGCAVTIFLYLLMFKVLTNFGIKI